VNLATSLCKWGFEVFKRLGGNEMNIQKIFKAKNHSNISERNEDFSKDYFSNNSP
jgi:hypothetical protein